MAVAIKVIRSFVLRSGDVGLQRCNLEGQLEGKPVLLYVALTACTGWNATDLRVSGMFFMREAGRVDLPYSQMWQTPLAEAWASGDKALVLRSLSSGKEYPLSLVLSSSWGSWRDTPEWRNIPGRISGELALNATDAEQLEFRVVPGGGDFYTACIFRASEARPPPWPPEQQPASPAQLGPLASAQRNLGDGPQRCAWLRTGRREQKGPSGGDTAARTASGHGPTTYMLLSAPCNLANPEYLSLLQHHMRYHEALGVKRYIAYNEGEGVRALARHPFIQEMLRSGRLRLVVWEEFPHFDGTRLYTRLLPRHPYAMQSLVYNHALQSLWGENAVVAIADLDEYLMTSRRMTVPQVLHECALGGHRDSAGLVLMRLTGICTGCLSAAAGGAVQPADDANAMARYLPDKALMERAFALERKLWLNTTVATQTLPQGLMRRHPLDLYGMTGYREYAGKSLSVPHRIAFTNPHDPYPMPAGKEVAWPHWADTSCAYWLHLRSQVIPRPLVANASVYQPIAKEFRWALDSLER